MPSLVLHSDIHLELQAPPGAWLEKEPDVAVLAGDITRIDEIAYSLIELSKKWTNTDIVFAAGNHEFYGMRDIQIEEDRLRSKLSDHDRIHFLQCESAEIQGIRFLGCTGWPQMTVLGTEHQAEAMRQAEKRIRDFSLIKFDGKPFTPEDCVALGNAHYQWLKDELAKPSSLPTVVVTHFAPALEYGNKRFPIDHLSAYFCADYGELITTFQPDYWLFGHTHYNIDTHSGKTRILSNQRGYGRECIDSYDPLFEIAIP